MKGIRLGLTGLFVLMLATTGRGAEVVLEQILQREHPAFHPAEARLTVGKDGKVYLASGGNATSFILRLDRDGSNRFGGTGVYAMGNATANADGVVATANAHFAHKVTLYDQNLTLRTAVEDFLNNDTVGWSAPPHVEAGSSGDFYGLDHARDRIVRLDAAGKILRAYRIPRQPAGNQGRAWDFRVAEKAELFYILPQGGPLYCVDFDGKIRWSFNAKTDPGLRWGDRGNAGGFDCDEAGTLFVLAAHSGKVQTYTSEGKPEAVIALEGGPAPAPAGRSEGAITELRLYKDDLVVRRRHPTELFRTYDRNGKHKHLAVAQHERLSATFPTRIWIAGENLPFKLAQTSGEGKALSSPAWHVRLRTIDENDYRFPAQWDPKLGIHVT